MKKSNFRKLLTMTVAVSALSMLLATGAGAESIAADNASASSTALEPGALTAAPPQTSSSLSVNSSYLYLANGSASLAPIGNGQMSISVDTTASTKVDTVTAYVTLQRYTGAVYVDVSNTNFSKSSTDYVSGNAVFTGVKGFYYRIKVVHSINKGAVYEQSTEYTDYVLCY